MESGAGRQHRVSGYPAKGAGISERSGIARRVLCVLFDQDPRSRCRCLRATRRATKWSCPSITRCSEAAWQERDSPRRRFLQRVVPAIASNSPDEKIPTDDVLAGFLKINGDLGGRTTST